MLLLDLLVVLMEYVNGKKEPCLKHGNKNVVKGQCPNFERPYSFYCFPAETTKDKEMNGFRLSNDKNRTEQNGLTSHETLSGNT